MSTSYKDSGVDIKAGEETVDKIKEIVKSTFNKNVLSGIGHFGAFYEMDFKKYENPVLVSSVDGVGTKLKVAFMMDKHDTVGQDLVNHCVNDIAVGGAIPHYFMDYMAFGKLDPRVAEKIMEGFAKACRENGVALIGGETAEMPGLYSEDEYDMSGTIVGIIEKAKILNGDKVKKGDALVGFPSTGLHTNGYSLARKVLFQKYSVNDKPEGFENTIGEELLQVHKSYLNLIQTIIGKMDVHAFSHITGGGIMGNTMRVVPEGLSLNIDWNSWKLPKIFELIKTTGNISDEEMRKAFNIGIGLIAIIDKNDLEKLKSIAEDIKEECFIIGNVE
ncbi:MAG: phosphoribosylformylglycinamidine cyclo-ligase [Bacteroidetes bacterium]|nr:phosphoribosylformylglycinamidine cyclo-ligase [Bacteroidota bacterium]MBU1113989.1 phosphoribosylformylglycinamidine cyclo-ligase [Bacteroidota bacterium]MBU1799809.1 phosphoribosylformylglycinamidine cyclo-ligase [Bacteroidota bacterium]